MLILNLIQTLNKYMETQAPWKLAKTDMKAAERVLYTAAESLRIVSIMFSPIMPEKTATPIACRISAPAPRATTSGNTPAMNAMLVIKIGRRRRRQRSR